MHEPDDAALLAAIRAGDRGALEALLVRHSPAVLRFARAMCDNPTDADDVAQDTLVKAARALRDFRGEGALSTWLYAITRNNCRRSHRRRAGAPVATVPVTAELDLEATGPGPEELTSEHELAATLDQEIRRLDPRMREVLVLRDVEGLSAAEVARTLGLQVATVKTRLHRGRAALRARLAPRLGPTLERSSTCPEVVTRFSRFLEGEIGPAECETLHAHVDQCASCTAACSSLRRSVALCRLAGENPPPDTVERVRAALAVVLAEVR